MFLKGFLHAKEETFYLGTAGKTILLSIMSLNGEEGSPCTSIFKAALLSCAAFRWKNDLLAARSTEAAPTIPPCCAWLFSTPKVLTPVVPEQLLHGAECWACSGNWAKLKITQQSNEPWLLSWPSSARSPWASSCRRRQKGGDSKGTVSQWSFQ